VRNFPEKRVDGPNLARGEVGSSRNFRREKGIFRANEFQVQEPCF
jgi:hypothetical protein